MQTKFSSPSYVAHLWVHQLQNEANYGQHFYFRGDTIYSYGAHFPMGKVVKYKDRKAYVLNSDHYSPTSSNHQTIVELSVPADALTFHVSNCISPMEVGEKLCRYDYAMSFIAEKLDEIVVNLEKQRRARSCDYRWNVINAISEIVRWIRFWELDKSNKWKTCKLPEVPQLKRYPSVFQFWKESNFDTIKDYCNTNDGDTAVNVSLFSLLCKLGYLTDVPHKADQIDVIMERYYGEECVAEINANIKKAKTRYKRRINKLKKAEIANNIKQLDEWRNGEGEYWAGGVDFCNQYGWNTALRIENNHIVTSKGISLSFDEGKRLWLIVKSFKHGEKFQQDLATDTYNHKWSLNSYENHVLTAGCHMIPFSECQRIADLMHWQ